MTPLVVLSWGDDQVLGSPALVVVSEFGYLQINSPASRGSNVKSGGPPRISGREPVNRQSLSIAIPAAG